MIIISYQFRGGIHSKLVIFNPWDANISYDVSRFNDFVSEQLNRNQNELFLQYVTQLHLYFQTNINITIWGFRISRRWRYRLWSSGLWRHVISQVLTNGSEERIASIFSDEVNMEEICSPKTSVTTYNNIRHQSPQDHDRRFHYKITIIQKVGLYWGHGIPHSSYPNNDCPWRQWKL
jgi:hypothetical protein